MKVENPYAFPIVGNSTEQNYLQEGMTLRDYFAAKAMQSFVYVYHRDATSNPEQIAKDAYNVADAMLNERNKKEK